MIKAIFSAAACCVLLAGCVAWGRGENGYFPVLVHVPDPRYPNVFVYPPAGDRKTGYAVVDQDPIVIRTGRSTTISWAVDATGGYVFKKIEFHVPNAPKKSTGLDALERACTRVGTPPRILNCTFDDASLPEQNGKRSVGYTITVGLPDTEKYNITTDPGIWMVD
jgi:hypothetical protein